MKFLKLSLGVRLLGFGLIFSLIESFWFGRFSTMGFNLKPQSSGELVCDYVALFIMICGIFLLQHEVFIIKKEEE